jgi:hypothetical protein
MAGASPFKAGLVEIARAESETLSVLRRGDKDLEDRVEIYRLDVGIPASASVTAHYSAVFISWCMRTAGASAAEFPAVASHWQYVNFALRNFQNGDGLFWARRIESYAPQLGDLIHVNRDGGGVDYDRIGYPYAAESGIVVELGQDRALIVMGNQEPLGNVGTEKLALDDSGLLIQRASNPLICVIEVRK